MGRLFEKDPLLPAVLDGGKAHRLAIRAARPEGEGETATSVREGLGDNHLFAKTYTTLGVSLEGFLHPDESGCHGYVGAHPNLDINPGHLGAIEDGLLRGGGEVRPPARTSGSQPLGRAADMHRFLVGRHDYSLELTLDPGAEQVRGLAVCDFFKLTKSLHDRVGCYAAAGRRETGLLDVSTSLVVPFPRIVGEDGTDALLGTVGRRHQSLMPLLVELRRRCFGPAEPGQTEPPLSMTVLQARLRELYLPLSLRRAVLYLFQVYAHCLSDPFLFDGVLDLHDTFLTLHNLVCQALPARQSGGPAEWLDRGVLSGKDLNQLEGFLCALQNAMSHRTASSLPNWEAQDMAIDFRGGLNRLLAAADVPLKCGLGILRRLTASTPATSAGPPPRNLVGAITRVTFNPSPGVSSLDAAEPLGLHLAYLDLDVAHLLDPFEYCLHAHEVGHLILRSEPGWEELLANETRLVTSRGLVDAAGPSESVAGDSGTEEDARNRSAANHISLDEIAVEMLTYLFVYTPSVDLFRSHLVIRYNSHTSNSGQRPQVALIQFGEILLRAFFVTDPFQLASGTSLHEVDPIDLPYPDDVDAAWRRFKEMTDDIGLYFREFNSCRGDSELMETVMEYYRGVFLHVYPRYRESVLRIWRVVVSVYQRAFSHTNAFPWLTRRAEEREHLERAVNDAVGAGRPFFAGLLRHYLAVEGFDMLTQTPQPARPALDEFQVVGSLLKAYLSRSLERLDKDRQMHVSRPSPSRVIAMSPDIGGAVPLSRALLDPLRSGLRFVNPSDRRDKVRWQVAVLKTLWDQSTLLRSRRMADLLAGAWPDASADHAK